jgi:hypothetical protein
VQRRPSPVQQLPPPPRRPPTVRQQDRRSTHEIPREQ